MTTARLQASQPIVFSDGTMQYHFRDFMITVDGIIASAGTTAQWGGLGGTLSDQTDLQSALNGKAATVHTHAATDVISGTFNDARIAESNIAQHQGALSITESQISDLGAYLTDAPSDGSTYGRNNGAWVVAGGGGGSGTVTSVAVTGTDGIEVDSGSPITTAGTIQLGINAGTLRTTINVEDGSTGDQSDAEIETAYNNQVAVVSQVDAEAGTSTTAARWTSERVKQAIAALGGSKAYASFYTATGGVTGISTTATTLIIASTRVTSGDFTLAGNQVTIDKTGTFEILFDCYFNNSSTSRTEYSKYMEVDTGGGFTEVVASRFVTYQRGYDSGMSASMILIDDFTSGDVIRFRVVRTDGGATVGYQDDNGTRLTIREI